MSKTIWMVGGGAEAVVGVRHARSLGYRVIVSDGNPKCPAAAVADRFVQVDTYAPQQTADAVQSIRSTQQVDGIMAMCSDVPLTIAVAARQNGLPGIDPSIASLATNKMLMKQALRKKGVPTARGWWVASPWDIVAHAPCVVKPVDSRGARGVTKFPSKSWTAENAYKAAVEASPIRSVLCEELLQGPQLSTETLIVNGGTYTFVLDRNYSRSDEFAPYIVEDGAHGPSTLPVLALQQVRALASSAALALLEHSSVTACPVTVKGDLVLTPTGPAVIELAFRLSGGYMSTVLLPEMTGVDVIGTAIRLACGEQVPLAEVQPRWSKGVAIRYDIPVGCRSHPERRGHAVGVADTVSGAIAKAQAQLSRTE